MLIVETFPSTDKQHYFDLYILPDLTDINELRAAIDDKRALPALILNVGFAYGTPMNELNTKQILTPSWMKDCLVNLSLYHRVEDVTERYELISNEQYNEMHQRQWENRVVQTEPKRRRWWNR